MIEEVIFSNFKKASSYYAIGGVRFYDHSEQIIPIKFKDKSKQTFNTFYSVGKYSWLSGEVEAGDAWGGNYHVSNAFNTDIYQLPSYYADHNYWLSSYYKIPLRIKFYTPVNIKRMEFIPYPENTSRKPVSIEVEVKYRGLSQKESQFYDLSNSKIDQVYEYHFRRFNKIIIRQDNELGYFFDDYYPFKEMKLTPEYFIESRMKNLYHLTSGERVLTYEEIDFEKKGDFFKKSIDLLGNQRFLKSIDKVDFVEEEIE